MEKEKIKNGIRIKLSAEDEDGLISYLYKTCRIGDVKNAMIAAEYIKRGVGEDYLAMTLHQIVGEDSHTEEYLRIFPTIWVYREAVEKGLQRPHDSWRCTYLVAKAKKWYMDEMPLSEFNGEETRVLSRLCYESLPQIKFPSWVWDSHTKLGRQLIEKNKADLRLDGRWEYGEQLRKEWIKFYKKHKNKKAETVRQLWIESFY